MKLRIKDVYFSYNSVEALRGVSLEVGDGEILALVGPNGSGKTTLLKCINRILKFKIGKILVKEKNIKQMKSQEIAKLVGYVPQDANSSFYSTVFDTVLLGRRPYITWSVSTKDKEVVAHLLNLMGLEGMATREFSQLSGGERQKVVIARALAQEPEILLLDEPTSNLDLRHQLEVLDLITNIVDKRGISAIMAIHDLNLAARYSHKVMMLKEGGVFSAGEVEAVFTEENIREVYGVEVKVSNSAGRPHIIALSPS
ncbi:MAG: ABC transporter ATP-binding protein [bacterium]